MQSNWSIIKGAVMTSLVVAPVLLLVNHYDRLAAGQSIPTLQVALTFTVPFLVSSFSAWRITRGSTPHP